jgi:predicted phosphodiesterase
VRVHVLSDLHLEFDYFEPPTPPADVVVLAGDVAPGLYGVEWAATMFPGRPVVYVPGNHEFFGYALPRQLEKLREQGRAFGVHVLSDEAVTIGGVRFLGATLWTDFRLRGDPHDPAALARVAMADYRKVRVSPTYRRLRPEDTVGWHRQSLRWLRRELVAGAYRTPTVVVTHHAPSPRSLAPAFLEDDLSAAYASELDVFVAGSGAQLWVHGHTHRSLDYTLGGTRVLSNQRGYPGETTGFREELVVEV